MILRVEEHNFNLDISYNLLIPNNKGIYTKPLWNKISEVFLKRRKPYHFYRSLKTTIFK